MLTNPLLGRILYVEDDGDTREMMILLLSHEGFSITGAGTGKRYIRYEPKSEVEVRLRFYHDGNNLVNIQVNSKEQGLPIGRVP